MVIAAIVAVGSNAEAARSSLEAASNAPWRWVALALILPPINLLLTALSFWLLTSRYGPVRYTEMASLIGASWLMNYLPLRPGLAGRIAYHKFVNGIAVSDSLRALMMNIGCGAAAAAGLAAVVWASAKPDRVPIAALAVFAPFAVLGLAAAIRPALRPLVWRLGQNLVIRHADLCVWALRYGAAFTIVGHEIGLGGALAAAVVSQVASLVPLSGNGLGLREWAVGLLAASLPAAYLGGAGSVTAGLSADLFNRAAELVATVPIGLVATAALARRLKAQQVPKPETASSV